MAYFIQNQQTRSPQIGDTVLYNGFKWEVAMLIPDQEYNIRLKRISKSGEMVIEHVKSSDLKK